jgi:glucose/arabinose dehydrogenase
MRLSLAAIGLISLAITGCSEGSTSPFAGFGERPELPTPKKALLPTVNIAKIAPWPAGEQPTAPAGFKVTRYAADLDHPRWLYVLPNGDVLAAESATEPAKPEGFRDWVAQIIQKQAGAAQKSPNQIILLRDADGDGIAEMKTVFAQGVKRPFGMALVGQTLYVAADDAIVTFPYQDGQTQETGAGTKVFDLPSGPGRTFASGIRNPNGMDFEPTTGALWTVSNERDEIGPDLPPDYLTSVKEGAFYGWPYSYYGQHVDERAKPQRPDLVAKAIAPDYGLGPHTASLGLAFYTADLFPAQYRGGAFIGQHGSWNRKPLNGYRVVFIPFAGGRPTGKPEVFLTGFLSDSGEAHGRPVGVAVDKRGGLLVADDVGDIVWRVAPTAAR